MRTTKQSMSNLLGEIAKAELDDVTLLTTLSEDAQVAKVFVDNFGLLQQQAKKYFSIDTDTKISLILENIYKACRDFDIARGVKLITLVTYYIEQAYKLELRAMDTDLRKANYIKEEEKRDDEGKTIDRLEESTLDDTTIFEVLDIATYSKFTDNEKYYIKAIITDRNVKDVDIANDLKVARCTITKMKKSIAKKLQEIGYVIAC